MVSLKNPGQQWHQLYPPVGMSEKLYLELFICKIAGANRHTFQVKIKWDPRVIAVTTSHNASAQLVDKGTECSVCGLLCVLYTAP